jgi:hypothetical protein
MDSPIFALNPFHTPLRLHALQGCLKVIHSVSINLSYCTTIDLLILECEMILLNANDHDAVYG